MLVNEKAETMPVKKIDLDIGDMIPHRKFAANIAEWPFNFSFISHYFGRKSTNCFPNTEALYNLFLPINLSFELSIYLCIHNKRNKKNHETQNVRIHTPRLVRLL